MAQVESQYHIGKNLKDHKDQLGHLAEEKTETQKRFSLTEITTFLTGTPALYSMTYRQPALSNMEKGYAQTTFPEPPRDFHASVDGHTYPTTSSSKAQQATVPCCQATFICAII